AGVAPTTSQVESPQPTTMIHHVNPQAQIQRPLASSNAASQAPEKSLNERAGEAIERAMKAISNSARSDGIACQGNSKWCWAFATAELLQQKGVPLSGPGVVKAALGGLFNHGAGPMEMLRAMRKHGVQGFVTGIFPERVLKEYLNRSDSGLIIQVPN